MKKDEKEKKIDDEIIKENTEEQEEVKTSTTETTTNESEKIQDDYKKLNDDFEKVTNSYQRLLADFENHKRRTAKEMLDEKLKGKEEVLKQILDIVDNFDRALSFDANTDEFKQGIEMVHTMFKERLQVVGLKEVVTEGELDADIHQAIAIDNIDDVEDNHILETLQKGYYVDEKLIRPAMVKVNKKEN